MIPVGIDRPLIRKPIMTLSIMGLNVLFFLLTYYHPQFDDLVVRFGYVPGYGSLATLFTSIFMHADWLHLLGNMFFFAVAGLKLEDALGHARFILFYLGCGLAASAVNSLLTGAVPIPSIGASGAIAGVLGGFMILYPFSKVRLMMFLYFHLISFSLPVWVFFGLWVVRETASLILSLGSGMQSGIAFGAHVGGFLAGAVWAWAHWGWNTGMELDMVASSEGGDVIYVAEDYQA